MASPSYQLFERGSGKWIGITDTVTTFHSSRHDAATFNRPLEEVIALHKLGYVSHTLTMHPIEGSL